jgi:hypothetical protein
MANADGKDVADNPSAMAGVLLILFPLLLMIHTRAAWVALGTAIVILCNKRLGSARRRQYRPPIQDDASI